ncbi:MAG: polysaccharide biosynthesis C-terminal domain-containing protein [Sphingobacteriales bacterium]|nr:polysaccharide biosynthesis C-terminal domain-containing protein [Sphingobacteriales bacterium]
MKEPSRFYSSLGLLLVLNVLVKPLWIFGIDRPVQNLSGTEVYGTYFSVFNFSFVLGFLLDWGLTQYMNRQLAADPAVFKKAAGHFLLLKLFLVFLYAAIVFALAAFSGVRDFQLLLLLILLQALGSFFLFTRAILTAQQWFRADAWFSVLDKVLMILVCGSFLLLPAWGPVTIEKFLLSQLTCTALALLTAFIFLRRKGFVFSFADKGWLKTRLFKEVLPYGLIVLLMSAHYRLDGFLVERIHPNGAQEAGIYAGAYRLLDAGNMAGYLVASFLLPFIAKQRERKEWVNEAVLNSRHLLMLFAVTAAATAIVLAPWLQSLLYHNRDPYAIEVMQFCIPALIGYSLVQVYGTVLTAAGHIRSFCLIISGALVLNILLNLAWIPVYGALGCCYAALVSQAGCGLAVFLTARAKTGVHTDLRSLVIYSLAGVMLFCFLYFGDPVISNKPLLLTAGCLLVLVLAVATKLADAGKWKQLFLHNK